MADQTDPPFPSGSTRGFSLIELMVVIAIIALLAGLLLPSLGRAKSSAVATACLSNLHQIGLGVELYVQENDHRLPICAQLPSLNTNLTPITTALHPFLQVSNIFRCPADRKTFTKEGTSYEWNIFLNGASYERPEDDISPVTQSVVDTIFGGRLNTPLLGDAAAYHGAGGGYTGKNALYFDGRVERVRQR